MFDSVGKCFLLLGLAALLGPANALALEVMEEEAESAAVTVLDTIVVTSSRMEESLRSVAASTTVLDEDRIKKSGAATLDKLLEKNGFYVVNYGASKHLKIRGMGQNAMSNEMESNVLILLNGRRLGANSVGALSLDNVERVEIVKGPSAVQYGSSAMGGVVNVITRRGLADYPQLAFEAGLGSFDLHREKLSFSGGAGGFDFSGGLTHYGQGDYKVGGGRTWQRSQVDSSTTVNLDLGYSFLEARHRLGLNFYQFDQNDVEMTTDGWSIVKDKKGRVRDYGNYDQRLYNLAFQYDGRNEGETLSWFARYAFGRDKNVGARQYTNPFMSPDGQTEIMDTDTLGAQIDYKGELLTAALGLDYVKYEYDKKSWYTGLASTHDHSIHEDLGLYLSTKFHLLDDRLIFSLAGRYDQFELSDAKTSRENNFAPSLGVVFFPLDWLKLRASYSEGFKMPTPTQLSGGSLGRYIYHPNPALKPEESKTFELGFDAAGEFWNVGLTYFHTDWENKILAVDHPLPNNYIAKNVTEALIEGLELDFGLDVGLMLEREFTLKPYLSLTYYLSRDNKDKAEAVRYGTRNLPNLPRYSLSYGLDYLCPQYDFSFNINAVHHGRQHSQRWTPTWTTENVAYSPGTVVDLSLEKGLVDFEGGGKLKLRLNANNIFDNDNEVYCDYPGPGRNYYAGLRYEFN